MLSRSEKRLSKYVFSSLHPTHDRPLNQPHQTCCNGPDFGGRNRRGFMRVGLAGFASMSLPGILRLRAESPLEGDPKKTAVILVWKPGGCSHIDTYDPKPDAES